MFYKLKNYTPIDAFIFSLCSRRKHAIRNGYQATNKANIAWSVGRVATIKTKSMNIIEFATQCPDAIISIKIGDLVEANKQLIEQTRDALSKSIRDKEETRYLTRDMVMEMLNISSPTLWRWAKTGYLVPINFGGQRRYRSTDIDEILEGKR